MAIENFELEVNPVITYSKWGSMKNVVIVAIAFMVHFTAFNGAANLQSSINAESGLGTGSLAAIYAGLVFSNIFLPAAVIKWLGTKWTICFMLITYMPYIMAQLHPRFYTMIPAALLLGLGAGPLWCAQCTYLSKSAESHPKSPKILTKDLVARFLGLFYMIFQTHQIWGNLISSLVLSSGNNTAAVTNVNESIIPLVCGANFLSGSNEIEALPSQPTEKLQMLVGIYLACMVGAALIIAFGVDSINRKDSKGSSEGGQSGFALLVVTLKHCAQPTQLLLITINIFNGLQLAFIGADFTASYVSCAFGTGSVGFVMMIFGLSNAFGCFITGYLVKIIKRPLLIVCTLFVHGAVLYTLLTWRPQAGEHYVLFIIAMFWGLCDSVWTVQMTAYYGIIFAGKEEAAYSTYRLFESIGYITAYVMSPAIRTRYHIYLLLFMMIAGVSGYLTVEYQQYKKTKVEVVETVEQTHIMKLDDDVVRIS